MSSESEALAGFLRSHARVSVLAGAGVSTASGIPEYRDRNGAWKHSKPVHYGDFVRDPTTRARYWARSFAGWHRISGAQPNAAHRALARLERDGRMHALITQNVDGLHQSAGSRRVIDLHGKLASVYCMACGARYRRDAWQRVLSASNPQWHAAAADFGPDGDARLDPADAAPFQVPDCRSCGGVVKPDVIFFGEAVPKERVAQAASSIERSDGLLVVGSSLMVYSGFRFVRMAAERRIPVAILNQGSTRGDPLAALKVDGDCATILPPAVAALA